MNFEDLETTFTTYGKDEPISLKCVNVEQAFIVLSAVSSVIECIPKWMSSTSDRSQRDSFLHDYESLDNFLETNLLDILKGGKSDEQ